ncbi:hypothetical protein [Streptomyces sp. NPDC015680]|uniref:hypothetical protein n=1 Tax=unclassified Streptomyces TaxID=2593676 RepID=UPI0036F7902F
MRLAPGLPVGILRILHGVLPVLPVLSVLPVLMCAGEPGERLKKWRAPAGPYRDT